MYFTGNTELPPKRTKTNVKQLLMLSDDHYADTNAIVPKYALLSLRGHVKC